MAHGTWRMAHGSLGSGSRTVHHERSLPGNGERRDGPATPAAAAPRSHQCSTPPTRGSGRCRTRDHQTPRPPHPHIELSVTTIFRPALALITAASDKLWLVAEVINSDDHHADTVDKKAVYGEMKLPRLWMVDPRYDNIEVYHGTPYGLTLKRV